MFSADDRIDRTYAQGGPPGMARPTAKELTERAWNKCMFSGRTAMKQLRVLVILAESGTRSS